MGHQRIRFLLVGLALPALVIWGWRSMSDGGEFNVTASELPGASAQPAAAAAGDCEPTPILVDLEQATLLIGGDATPVLSIDPICPGRYELVMVSGDRNHQAGFQSGQTDERWMLEFVDGTGATQSTSSSTDDLADDRTIAVKTETVDLPAGITGVRVRHTGPAGVVNSISAIGLALIPSSTDVDCDESSTVVYFDGPALWSGDQESHTVDAFETCLCLQQHLVTVSQDVDHEPGYQPDQVNEQWSVTATNSDGDVLGETEPTADLAEGRWASLDLLSMESDLEAGEITFTATNTAGVGPNSIDPVAVVIAAH